MEDRIISYTVGMPASLAAVLDDMAYKEGISRSEMVRRLIEEEKRRQDEKHA